LLAGDSENVCFILDDHQSIYGFRGADIEAVMNVRNIYHNMKIFNLSRNYRCSQTIVEASKSLIAKNTPLIDKKIRAARDYAGSPIIISRTKTPQQEALKVVQYIQALRRKGLKYSDICIEYRMSAASRVLEEALNKAKIKCKIVGGTPFFARAEIQDVLAYLRLIVNEHDFTAFKRAIGVPKRGVGEKTIEKIDEFAREYPGGPIPIRSAIEEIELKGKAGNSIKEFVKFLDDLEVDMAQLAPKDLITKLCTKLQIVDYLQTAYKDNWQERLENIQELVNVASEYADVQELLSQAALYSIEENDEKVDAVNMMTMHSSKGLEFPAVIIVGCNEGTSPHYKSLGNPKQLEEERRLFYVAMTRAKDYLFMTFSDCVLVQGQLQYSKPSRFINEIDKKYIYRN
jgi:DNA helicase-2/ATP-dependent DNA helicase PcrA